MTLDVRDPATASTPARPRRRRRWMVAAGLVLAVVLGATWWSHRQADVRAGTDAVTVDEMAGRYGVDVNLVAVTARGGLVELRYQVVDPDKANRLLHDEELSPILVEEASGSDAADGLATPPPRSRAEPGGEYFFLMANTRNALRQGSLGDPGDRRRPARAPHRRRLTGGRGKAPPPGLRSWRFVSALLVTSAPSASAHTELLRSDPPNGGMVAEGRTELTLWFDEAVGASFEQRRGAHARRSRWSPRSSPSTRTATPDGRPTGCARARVLRHRLARLLHGGRPCLDRAGGLRLRAATRRGRHAWGERPPRSCWWRGGSTSPRCSSPWARWPSAGRVLAEAGPGGAGVRRRTRRYAATAAMLGCYSGLLAAFLRTRAAGAPLQTWVEQTGLTLVASSWGNLWLARERPSSSPPWRCGAGGATVPSDTVAWRRCALVWPCSPRRSRGMPPGFADRSTVAALMTAGHVLAAGVWVGGLAVLAVTVLRALRSRPGRGASRPGVWRAYSPRAALASGVLLATGLYEAGRHVPTREPGRHALRPRRSWSRTLLLVGALALAGVNTLLVNPDLVLAMARSAGRLPRGDDGRRPSCAPWTIEVVVLGVAVLAAGVLTSVPTSREVAVATRPAVPHVENTDGMFVTVEAVPDGPAQRRIVVRAVPTVLPSRLR